MTEQIIIGTWLQRNQLELTAVTRAEWFTDPDMKALCLIIQAMYANNEYIDNVAVVQKNKKLAVAIATSNQFAEFGSIARHVQFLHQEWIRRTLVESMTKSVKFMQDGGDIMESIASTQKMLDELQIIEDGKATELIPLLAERLDSLEQRSKAEIKTIGHPTGWMTLDKYIGGFVPGENVVVAGRPGMGKTAFAVSIGIAHAKRGGKVVMFSMEMSKEQLADRILTGATVVTTDIGMKLDQVGLEVLGRARRVVLDKDNTTIVDGAGDKKRVQDRISELRKEIEITDSDWDRTKLQERLAKLAGGVCVIKVGAHTEVELKEKKHRLEDAISATRAAVEEGIVVGGGAALVHAVDSLEGDLGFTGDKAVGVRLVRKAADEPLRWIAENAGLEGYVVVSKVRAMKPNEGYNAATDVYGDLTKDGVIDPVKVTRSALANAASIAAMFITTEAVVFESKEEEVADSGHGHKHGPGGHTH